MSSARPDERPNPDALLRQVNAETRSRARLKIFFGFAPGVGKTYAMLESARRLSAQGASVVVGLVETHGRAETSALLDGLEVLARKRVDYRGRSLEEFDLERALNRKPQVLLLDELAHTNVPGSRHQQRWQDVLELLDAGIEVHTTLNVQHVESLNDVVQQITGVQVRETVPDSVLERADGIELVDLPPEELLRRLREGKVYLPEQARRATEHFFREGNLLALRELALRRTAERVDRAVQDYRRLHDIQSTWPASERVVVCVGPSPASAKLVRAARRIAAGLRAPWHALTVSNPLTPLSREDEQRLEAHLELAQSLGGDVVRLSDAVMAEALLSWAREHNVTRIVLGKPTHTWWRDRLRGSLLDAVVRGSGGIDVLVISGDEPHLSAVTATPTSRATAPWWAYLGSVAAIALTTAVNHLLHHTLQMPDPEVLYLAAIMLVAAGLGLGPALLAAALSVGAYDFFFVPPYFTFAVTDSRYGLTFTMMFAVGVVTSTLVSRLRSQELEARRREADTRALLSLTRELAQAASATELARSLGRAVVEAAQGQAMVFLPSPSGLVCEATVPTSTALDTSDLGVVQWAQEHQREAGLTTQTLSGARVLAVPLGRGAGVLAWRPGAEAQVATRRAMLDALCRQAGLALDRLRYEEAAQASALRARTEELRSSLLSTVSHDLRTPLAVVTGAATTLRDQHDLGPEFRAQLLDTIVDEAERLERLVRNLLDMTRVQAGALSVKKEWVPVDELIGSARTRLAQALSGRPVTVHITPEGAQVQVDPALFEQVLFNLLDNASKYTPPNSPLELTVELQGALARLTLADRGPGVPEAERDRLFDKFYRGAQPNSVPGAGLGLAICRGIVEAHGGALHVEGRDGGGARFVITLPSEGAPPGVPSEEPT